MQLDQAADALLGIAVTLDGIAAQLRAGSDELFRTSAAQHADNLRAIILAKEAERLRRQARALLLVARMIDNTFETRVRMVFLTDEHRAHKLTLNIYISDAGATESRVWCTTCQRTLRIRSRIPKPGEEVVLGFG